MSSNAFARSRPRVRYQRAPKTPLCDHPRFLQVVNELARLNEIKKKQECYYITTPVFYVNSSPHIGHVHTLLLADAINIYQWLSSKDTDGHSIREKTIFSTGTDEHGLKIQNASRLQRLNCEDFCNFNSAKFRDLFSKYDTTMTDFVRTSDKNHEEAVKSVWNNLKNKGYIYKSTYSGWYCESDETFVPESSVSQKEIGGELIHVDQNDNRVLWSQEDNYMFRLNDLKDRVLNWLVSHKPVIPEKFNDDAIRILKSNDLGDISISRPVKRLSWGVKVPDDPSQTVYVWLDALTNYLTVAGYPCEMADLRRWPIDCQVIGKDIIKFHSIYWPAFLIALSLPLPRKLVCHSHWLIDSHKMSKSRGNVVIPDEENQLLTIEGLRYYLLRCSTPHSDTDYNRTQALRRVNSELADTYGNLMSRCCAPAINPKQMISTRLTDDASPSVIEIQNRLSELANICSKHYDCADFYKGVDEIMALLRLNNGLYETTKPWELIKKVESNPDCFREYSNLQTITFETLRICSILLQPIVPRIAGLALEHLKVDSRSWANANVSIQMGDPTSHQRSLNRGTQPILFRRLKVT